MVGMWVSNTVRNMRFVYRTTDSTHFVLTRIKGTILIELKFTKHKLV